MSKPYKIISLHSPESDLPKDVHETGTYEDARDYAEHMANCGHYVVVECDGKFLYKIDGRSKL